MKSHKYWSLSLIHIFSAAGSDRYGALQAPHMVCVLSDGNHDAGHLQAEKQRINKDNRTEPFSWLN